jgi:predicted amidohydrolase
MTKVRVGAVQAEPVWNDLQGSVAKTIKLIKEAGEKGINVLGFPEVWIPGYLWYVYCALCIAMDSSTYMAKFDSLKHPFN